MIERIAIGSLVGSAVGEDVISDLLTISRKGGRPSSGFYLEGLPREEEVSVALLERLKSAGLEPHPRLQMNPDPKRYFGFALIRDYSQGELEQCGLLQLYDGSSSSAGILAHRRTPLGQMALDLKTARKNAFPKVPVAFHMGVCLVRDSVRQQIQASPLKHVVLRETVLRADALNPSPIVPWSEVPAEPWWELTSDITMPPLAPSISLMYWQDRRPLTTAEHRGRRWCDGILPFEGFYDRPELRYAKGHLDDHKYYMPKEWDAARTYEPFGHRVWGWHPIVCSQRFYRFFRDAGLGADWVPVHVTDDKV